MYKGSLLLFGLQNYCYECAYGDMYFAELSDWWGVLYD